MDECPGANTNIKNITGSMALFNSMQFLLKDGGDF